MFILIFSFLLHFQSGKEKTRLLKGKFGENVKFQEKYICNNISQNLTYFLLVRGIIRLL